MDLLFALLLTLIAEGHAPGLDASFGRANTRAHGMGILRGKRVLMFGDSMVNCGINIWLEPWLKRHGVRSYVTRSWASSTTVTWSKAKKLDVFMWRHDPDIVFIVLGSNELFHPSPRMKIRPIRRILKKMGRRRSVYWIGPPTWAKDKGLIKTIRAQMPPGHFFDSGKVKMTRKKDGYHPDLAGAKVWAAAIWRWYSSRLRAPGRPTARPAAAAGSRHRPPGKIGHR